MAKKKVETMHEAETKMSIGSMMKSKHSQRDRNLLVKAEMIEAGTHPEPKIPANQTVKERNLALKAQLKDEKAKGKG